MSIEGVSLLRTLQIMKDFSYRYNSDLRKMPHTETLKSFFYYVSRGIKYKSEAENEIIKRPYITAMQGGDCDDKAILLAAYINRFMQLKVQTHYYKVVDYGSGWVHVYNCIFLKNGKILNLDSTYPQNKFGEEKEYKKHFLYGV